MKHRVPDIKTADVFFEIMSNPKKVLEHIGEMKKIRDDIQAGLETVDTKEKADNLLREASGKMADAREYEDRTKADSDAASSQLSADIGNHGVIVARDRAKIKNDEKTLAALTAEFTRSSGQTNTDLENRRVDVSAREDSVLMREEKVTERENAANVWSKNMAEAKEAMDRVR